MTPTLISYNLALAACAKAGQGDAAMAALAEAEGAGLKPDTVTYSSVIAALSRRENRPTPAAGIPS